MGTIFDFLHTIWNGKRPASSQTSQKATSAKQNPPPPQSTQAPKQPAPASTYPLEQEKTQLTVYDYAGTALQLPEDNIVAGGREGTVYSMPKKDNILIKLYNKLQIDNREKHQRNTERLRTMFKLLHKLNLGNCQKIPLAWPVMPIFDKNKTIIGFAMYKCDGVSFRALGSIAGIKRYFPDWTRRELALTALDFVKKLRNLQKSGVQINDFNPSNFLVDRNCNVSFIDCDSFQIAEGNKIHVTNTFISSHCAPELLKDKRLLDLPRNAHHLEFGAAIVIFNLLMCGLHPYAYHDPLQMTACGNPEENLLNGRCPLGVGAGCKFPIGNWYNLWSWTSHNVKGGFIRTFRDGHSNPAARTSLADWEKYLHEMIVQMSKYPERTEIFPEQPNRNAVGSKRFRSGMSFSNSF